MCRDRASHCKMLFRLPPWMTMSMVYKASILSDFRTFQVKGMYLKHIKKIPVNTSSYPEECITCRFATFVVLKIDVHLFPSSTSTFRTT